MTHTCFDLNVTDGIAHIQLCRPEKRNSMIPEFWEELPAIVRDIDARSAARAIVISSQGPHFSAGLDLGAFAPGADHDGSADDAAASRRRRQRGLAFYQQCLHMQDSFSVLERCRMPVLAAVQGGAIGGGVDLATACDMRYCTADAYFVIQETNIAMTADVGTFPRLAKLVPEGLVRELAYTGRWLGADEALRAGLVNRVFDSQPAMVDGVLAIAGEIARRAPLAVHGCKRMINYARDHSTADGLDYISIWNASMLQPEEMAEALAAQREQRAGDFVELPPLPATRRDHQ